MAAQGEPVAPSRPRQRKVPPARPRRRRDPRFSTEVPRRGWEDAVYHLDTGVLFAASVDAVCGSRMVRHYRGRLHTTDVIVAEVRHRATNPTNKPGVQEAAEEAVRMFIDGAAVAIDELGPGDVWMFESVLQQLRQLEAAQADGPASPQVRAKHGGEASAIVCCLREMDSGARVVFATNDGGASRVAHSRQVHTRHFGHLLNELVCAATYRNEEAFALFERANRITGVPAVARPQGEQDLSCQAAADGCTACVG
ncbi:hypothetical protein MOQ72_12875 [Saccharopolyspora sp. K220]|uniref:hypothetical protein n=1 Tax=Saccharopolyspora soli TaxID=2926618 RepID=UPI001F56BDF2|nr:hypothetical protein [Saccharopolyspora soli]MCI2418326.1 hypothetical protein [Saccharopolyspora soli]